MEYYVVSVFSGNARGEGVTDVHFIKGKKRLEKMIKENERTKRILQKRNIALAQMDSEWGDSEVEKLNWMELEVPRKGTYVFAVYLKPFYNNSPLGYAWGEVDRLTSGKIRDKLEGLFRDFNITDDRDYDFDEDPSKKELRMIIFTKDGRVKKVLDAYSSDAKKYLPKKKTRRRVSRNNEFTMGR